MILHTLREPPLSPFLERWSILSTLASFEQGDWLLFCLPGSGTQKSASLWQTALCTNLLSFISMDPGSQPASWLEEAGIHFSSFIEGRKCSQNGRRLRFGVRVKSKDRYLANVSRWGSCIGGSHLIAIHHNSTFSFHSPGVVGEGDWPPPPDLEKRAGALPTFLLSISGQRWLFPTHLPRMFSRIPECSDRLTHTVMHTGLSV